MLNKFYLKTETKLNHIDVIYVKQQILLLAIPFCFKQISRDHLPWIMNVTPDILTMYDRNILININLAYLYIQWRHQMAMTFSVDFFLFLREI